MGFHWKHKEPVFSLKLKTGPLDHNILMQYCPEKYICQKADGKHDRRKTVGGCKSLIDFTDVVWFYQ